MNIKDGISRIKDRWTLKKEERAQIQNLKTLSADSAEYKATMSSIEQCSNIRNSKKESRAKVLKDIGMLGLCAGALFLSFGFDASDKINRNKYTKEMFNKIFKP